MNKITKSMIIMLKDLGCKPGIYKRGNLYRAHVNKCGNFWSDHQCAERAMADAIMSWYDHGKPMDGLADSPGNRKISSIKKFKKIAKELSDKLGKDRDDLRDLIEGHEDLLNSIDEGKDELDGAIDKLSEFV